MRGVPPVPPPSADGGGHDHAGHDHAGHDHAGHDHAGHDHAGHGHAGHDHAGHDHAGHDHAGHDHAGHEHAGHDHDHRHLAAVGERRVQVVLALVVAYMVVELVAGLWSGSLALVADAAHMTSDAAALGIALFAMRVARRPASPSRTFGYHRAEVLAATVNGAGLLAIAVGILWEAAERFTAPAPVVGPVVLGVAAGGLAVNLVALTLLASSREGSLTLRSAWLHALSDALGSVGAMAAGLAVWQLGWAWADPAVSVVIALLILRGAWSLLNEAVGVLMEGVPAHVDPLAIRAAVGALPGVRSVHDLHVWCIGSRQVTLTAHLVAEDGADPVGLLRATTALLRDRFAIHHATVQVEPPDFEDGEIHP